MILPLSVAASLSGSLLHAHLRQAKGCIDSLPQLGGQPYHPLPEKQILDVPGFQT